jgi:uncharacterized protein (UPF0216 family)
LEAFIAAQDAHDHYAERDEVKSLREKVAELEADATMLRDRLAREMVAQDNRKVIENDADYCAAYVMGYDAAMQEETDILTQANARIAELEALNAHLRREYTELAARPQATGVVVDDAMVERFCRQFFANNGFWSGAHWMPSDKTRDDARNAMYAALTSATLVPLASAGAVRWMSETGHIMNYQPGVICCVPVYEGIKAVRDGE